MARAKKKRLRRRGDRYPVPRIYHRKAHGKKSAIKCGDCDNKFEIYYGPQGEDLEIAGVLASVKNWRRILLPLLKKGAGESSETGYLLRSAANAKRLMSSLKALNRTAPPPRPEIVDFTFPFESRISSLVTCSPTDESAVADHSSLPLCIRANASQWSKLVSVTVGG